MLGMLDDSDAANNKGKSTHLSPTFSFTASATTSAIIDIFAPAKSDTGQRICVSASANCHVNGASLNFASCHGAVFIGFQVSGLESWD